MVAIAVSSFKGGTAKTSTALHLGTVLARDHGARVLLLDFDAQANLTTGLGFNPDEQESMAAVLLQQKSLEEVLVHTTIPQLDLIPADTWLERVEVTGVLASDRYSHERLREIVQTLSLTYDYIIMDTPPSLCWLTESALIAADYVLICAMPEFYSIKGLHRFSLFIQGIAQRHSLKLLGVLLSFWNPRGKNNASFLEFIEQIFPAQLLETKIRRDISVSEASIFGKPVFDVDKESRAGEDYRALTRELLQRMQETVQKELVHHE